MAYFQPIKSSQFIPESYLPTAPYLPLHFLPQQQSLTADNFNYEIDERGQTSIIYLLANDEILTPFIDINNYDAESKDWFWYDSISDLPYRYLKATNTLENIYPSKYNTLVLNSTIAFNSIEKRIEAEFKDATDQLVTCYKYSPLLLTVNDKAYTDLSDYSNFKPTDRLNKTTTTVTEFYYDFSSRVFTNQNLAGIDPAQIKLHFFKVTDNTVQLKCRMSANAGSETFWTPRVNYYIVKLKGQSFV